MNTATMLELAKEIRFIRQDSHVTAWKCFKQQQQWKDVNDADISEGRRLGRIV